MKNFPSGKRRIVFILCLCFFNITLSQETAVEGIVLDAISGEPLSDVSVSLEGTYFEEKTDEKGYFSFSYELPEGEQILIFSRINYLQVRFPVTIQNGATRSLGTINLQPQILPDQQQLSTISLADHELDEEEGGFDNISGLLQSTKDVFLNAAAFDFSPTFFRPRGLDSDNGKLLINGIEMNKLFNGRPQWSNWGGLNDVQRNQVFSMGLDASEVSFGGLAGTTNILMRASEYAPGGKVSYAISNRGYSGRIMGSYSSGLQSNGWAYTIALSRRFAEESFRDGTLYDANSFFVAVEKKINDNHSLNFSGIFTPNRRGKSSANTQEVYDLKGIKYNSYWGYQDGEIRNSRIRNIQEPILMLNHYWKISETININNNLAYQFGSEGNSRLDYGGSRLLTGPDGNEIFIGGGSNPEPSYYQKLPSYFLRFEDDKNYQAAYLAQQDFIENGQLDWTALYSANQTMAAAGGNSIYILYEDRNEDRLFIANSILDVELTPKVNLNGKLSFRKLISENFAQVLDLLGGNTFLDVDS
ncbi:MAG TPA: carboxypeptidase-like regulatory domain-containing protein, partial [Salinimicrobium sp.]|nr:carboxypeptidase-like regulatory domain-containing protein [Salinimicrobium sp.]